LGNKKALNGIPLRADLERGGGSLVYGPSPLLSPGGRGVIIIAVMVMRGFTGEIGNEKCAIVS